jgi:hypothetical protein
VKRVTHCEVFSQVWTIFSLRQGKSDDHYRLYSSCNPTARHALILGRNNDSGRKQPGYAPGLDRFQVPLVGWLLKCSGDCFLGVAARPVALCSQAISSLSGGLSASDRAEPRAEHPGVNSDCVVDAGVVARNHDEVIE